MCLAGWLVCAVSEIPRFSPTTLQMLYVSAYGDQTLSKKGGTLFMQNWSQKSMASSLFGSIPRTHCMVAAHLWRTPLYLTFSNISSSERGSLSMGKDGFPGDS